jgi:hypothetical protein
MPEGESIKALGETARTGCWPMHDQNVGSPSSDIWGA